MGTGNTLKKFLRKEKDDRAEPGQIPGVPRPPEVERPAEVLRAVGPDSRYEQSSKVIIKAIEEESERLRWQRPRLFDALKTLNQQGDPSTSHRVKELITEIGHLTDEVETARQDNVRLKQDIYAAREYNGWQERDMLADTPSSPNLTEPFDPARLQDGQLDYQFQELLRQKNNELRQKNDELRQNNETFRRELDVCVSNLKQIRQQNGKLEQSNSWAEEQNKQLDQQNEQLSQQVGPLKRDNNDLRHRLNESTQNLQAALDAKDSLEKNQATVKASYENRIEELKSKHQNKLAEREAQHKADVEKLNREHKQAIESLGKDHNSKTQQLMKAHTIEKGRLTETNDALSTQLLTRDDFRPISDVDLKARFVEFASEVEQAARLEWTVTYPNTYRSTGRTSAVSWLNTRLKKYILQDCIWAVLHEWVFCSPFRVFGDEGTYLEAEWNKQCGADPGQDNGYYVWPPPKMATERWRYVNVTEGHAALLTPLPSVHDPRNKLRNGYITAQKELKVQLRSVLDEVTSPDNENNRIINKLTREAARLWLDFTMQRCRVLIMTHKPDLPSVAARVAEAQTGAIELLIVPSLQRIGNSKGQHLQEAPTIIQGCDGEVVEVRNGVLVEDY